MYFGMSFNPKSKLINCIWGIPLFWAWSLLVVFRNGPMTYGVSITLFFTAIGLLSLFIKCSMYKKIEVKLEEENFYISFPDKKYSIPYKELVSIEYKQGLWPRLNPPLIIESEKYKLVLPHDLDGIGRFFHEGLPEIKRLTNNAI